MSTDIDVCSVDEIEDVTIVRQVAGDHVCFVCRDGEIFAFAASCTHRQCAMEDAEIDDGVIICPCHGAEFDAKTGEVLLGPAMTALPVYKTRVLDGRVKVTL